jgi:predicted DNA-binding protein YlxM (UPF0122 family)
MLKDKSGVFCRVYGNSLRNKVLEYMLEFGELDFATGDIARELQISRPKVYQIIGELVSSNILIKSRIVSGTQLYSLNNNLNLVKLLKKSFKECLKVTVESPRVKNHKGESKIVSKNASVGVGV